MYLHHDFSPIFGSKNVHYYQAILKETHLVVIEATDRNNRDIAFLKFLIRKYPNQPKSFTYIDYMYAWKGALIYENSLKRHSWFLKFQIDNQRGALPSWFKSWFFHWGY
ncbi:hypothetical protein CDL12_20429 [Handroanthus impetiginosus]|uniref:Uncharacterized protein n=1 Tax=Handroanthus impetiginosus TaxID=429701 RepID=A0A2G9GNZ3_9LAMI|nr:hypothetical protein CDL12_20429 [Handroanthus impetiginosus]